MTHARPLDATSRIVAAGDQVSTELEGEAVILHLGDGIYYGLNAVGARLWSLLEEPRAVAELRDALVADYEVDAETAERDVIELMDELMERGLVEPATDG
ncbi:PqqD family peptide modification chaperone [Longimicrobium terrae]|uniref:PqqD family protein n=1 Tax=Longimicrobium terrae TaxID=1639882 RepID=A0A841GIM6_9BACT|nr:hypothetical protein [Longimicrobium terrae]MBB6068407.1 hypothetical protein [Longimicrobium terrae]NNC32687.1 PqqD family protein [Longimicrobium terrae]